MLGVLDYNWRNMKSTGIVRRVDELGRIVIPKELRRSFSINEKDPLEIFVEEDTIILKQYRPLCYICGGSSDLKSYKDRKICSDCREELSNL